MKVKSYGEKSIAPIAYLISSIVPTIAPKLYVPADFLKSAHLTPWGGSPSNATTGSEPFTSAAANATFEPLRAYVSRFSGSVIVNVAPALKVRLLELHGFSLAVTFKLDFRVVPVVAHKTLFVGLVVHVHGCSRWLWNESHASRTLANSMALYN